MKKSIFGIIALSLTLMGFAKSAEKFSSLKTVIQVADHESTGNGSRG